MATIELGRFNDIDAHILIGRLRSEGIGAFPAPTSPAGLWGGLWTSVLIDEGDLAAARRIAVENLSEDP